MTLHHHSRSLYSLLTILTYKDKQSDKEHPLQLCAPLSTISIRFAVLFVFALLTGFFAGLLITSTHFFSTYSSGTSTQLASSLCSDSALSLMLLSMKGEQSNVALDTYGPDRTCASSITFFLAPHGAGLSSHIHVLTTAWLHAILLNRSFFVEDNNFNYGEWRWYFPPLPEFSVLSPHLLNSASVSRRESPLLPEKGGKTDQRTLVSHSALHALAVILQKESQQTDVVWPLAASKASAQQVSHSSASTCTRPHPLELGYATWHVNSLDAMQLPRWLNLSHRDFVTPGMYRNPIFTEFLLLNPAGSSLGPSTTSSSTSDNDIFNMMLFRRYLLRSYIYPVQSITEKASKWIKDNGLISKDEKSRLGARFICVHVRKGDKLTSLGLSRHIDTSEPYLAALLHALLHHPTVNSSWSKLDLSQHSLSLRTQCEVSADYRDMVTHQWTQPHIVIISDDQQALRSLPLKKPCWRWHFPFATSAVENGHDQHYFDSLPMQERYGLSHNFLAQLIIAAHADVAIVTYSSNTGRLIATLRGYHNSHSQHRVLSVDGRWKEY